MTRNEVFPSNYAKKDDFPVPARLTINDVKIVDLKSDNGDERKPVLDFLEEQAKPLILNVGNWTVIEEAYGPDSNDWRGKPVEVYNDPNVQFAGRRTGGIRVRIPNGIAPTAAAPAGWTMDQAVTEAVKMGITREQIVERIKASGATGYVPNRDTALVQNMIADAGSIETAF